MITVAIFVVETLHGFLRAI